MGTHRPDVVTLGVAESKVYGLACHCCDFTLTNES